MIRACLSSSSSSVLLTPSMHLCRKPSSESGSGHGLLFPFPSFGGSRGDSSLNAASSPSLGHGAGLEQFPASQLTKMLLVAPRTSHTSLLSSFHAPRRVRKATLPPFILRTTNCLQLQQLLLLLPATAPSAPPAAHNGEGPKVPLMIWVDAM